ncbi:MAG: hypothetical protein P8P36_05505 [Akkermansiaceae bacterium]|nr:hypothetical protein [Akkermansiaceae bacterium]
MKSRFNDHSHELHRRQFSYQNEPRSYQRLPRPSSQMNAGSLPRWDHANIIKEESHSQDHTKNEIPILELNDFCLSCIEQLSLAKHNDSRDEIITNLISKKLTRYNELTADLDQLALKCIEQDMQLQYRVEQFKLRVSSLEQTVSQHLIQVGQEIGLPEKIMVKLAKLVVQVMHR